MGLYFNINLDKNNNTIDTKSFLLGGGRGVNRILLQMIVSFAIKNFRYNGKKKRA